MKQLVLISVIVLIGYIGNALGIQFKEGAPIKISGKVLDSETNLPLPFANIIYNNKGTSTNMDGEFVFQISYHEAENLLFIKFIGYETAAIALSQDNTNLAIALTPSAEMLEEVVVYTADQVLQDVNNYRQINYEYANQMLTSYYKESMSTNKQCLYLAEGVFDIYYPTIYSHDKPSIHAQKTRKKTFVDLDSMQAPRFHGHASDMINGITRRSDSFINKDEIHNYSFEKEGLSWYDGREVFKINFEPKNKKAKSRGTLFIDSHSKAVIRVEYEPLLDHQYFWTKVKWTEEYKEVNSSWYIHRVSYLGQWNQEGQTISFDALLVVTDFKSAVSKPKMTETLDKKDVFFEQASGFSDNFWEEHNYIKLSSREKLALGY